MSLVRLYYSSIDVKPGALLRHFLRFLGFYVEEISGNTKKSNVVSIADVYIISDAYSEYENNGDESIDVPDEKKTIAICKDGWYMDDSDVRVIYYEGKEDKKFLKTFLSYLGAIMKRDASVLGSLIGSVWDWEEVTGKVAKSYLRHKIWQMAQYTRCFYRQDTLFRIALTRYRKFISDIKHLAEEQDYPDLLEYTSIYAKYELDLICKRNQYTYYASPDRLLEICEGLLQSYRESEQLYLLRADIHGELKGKWLQAYDEYDEYAVMHCAYADYKCGRILTEYLKDYRNAVYALESAVSRKRDYYKAWYELGVCYEAKARYKKAIEHYMQVYLILQDKLIEHLLEPIELEYLYKSMIKAALIKKNNEGDYLLAQRYNGEAEQIKKEIEDETYLALVWPEALNNEKLKSCIQNEMRRHMNIQIEKIY